MPKKQKENTLSKSTKEDKEEEARLEAELINLETAKLTKQKVHVLSVLVTIFIYHIAWRTIIPVY